MLQSKGQWEEALNWQETTAVEGRSIESSSTCSRLSRLPLKLRSTSTDTSWWVTCQTSCVAHRPAWWRTCAWRTGVCTGCGRCEWEGKCSCGYLSHRQRSTLPMHMCTRWMKDPKRLSRSSMTYWAWCRSRSRLLRINLKTLRNSSIRYSSGKRTMTMKITKTKKERHQIPLNLLTLLTWLLRMIWCHQREPSVIKIPNSN